MVAPVHDAPCLLRSFRALLSQSPTPEQPRGPPQADTGRCCEARTAWAFASLADPDRMGLTFSGRG